MRIWFRFDPGDAPAVRARLNELAARGWELAEGQDCSCFFARLERTGRGELTYDVEPASPFRTAEELEHQVRLRAAEGWESVATLNGMDIYRAAPLRFPEPHSGKPPRGTLAQCWLFSWIGLLAAALLSLGLLLTGQGAWYLSNALIYLRFTGIPALVGAICWLSRPVALLLGRPMEKGTRQGMYFRSVLGTLGLVWCFGLCVSVALDWLNWLMVLLVAAIWLTAVLCSSGLWRRKSFGQFRQVTALITGIAVLSIAALTLVYPVQKRADLLQSGERSRYSASALVQLEDLTDESGEFLSGSWAQSGSLLVSKTTYEEWWTVNGSRVKVHCERYVCHLGTAAWVRPDLEGTAFAQNGGTLVSVETTLSADPTLLTGAAEEAASH